MISILNSASSPEHLTLLREWYIAEWGKIDPFSGGPNGLLVPTPLLAVNDGELIGGLAFTSAVMPESSEFGVWVNAVLVLPEYRGKGLASRLIQQAKVHAQAINIPELFAYTAIPDLYRKQGWQVVDTSQECVVLKTGTPL